MSDGREVLVFLIDDEPTNESLEMTARFDKTEFDSLSPTGLMALLEALQQAAELVAKRISPEKAN